MPPKPGGRHCVVKNCKSRSGVPGMHFFRFPKDIARAKEWALRIGRKDLLRPSEILHLNASYRLCSLHFEREMFMNHLKESLIHNAVPKILPPSKDTEKVEPISMYMDEDIANRRKLLKRTAVPSLNLPKESDIPEAPNEIASDELLILLVKNRPDLYDFRSPLSHDNDYKKKMWDEIEKLLQITGPRVGAKVRWESLRTQYRKQIEKLRTKNGTSAAKVSKWKYYDQMQFLNDVENAPVVPINYDKIDYESIIVSKNILKTNKIKHKDEIEDLIPKAECISAEESANSENLDITPAELKYLTEKNSEDEIDQFFTLMATTVKKFSPLDQHAAKEQVFALISKIEEQYLTSSFFLPSDSPSDSSSALQGHFLDVRQFSQFDRNGSPTPSSSYLDSSRGQENDENTR